MYLIIVCLFNLVFVVLYISSSIQIPFSTERLASIAFQVLSADREPKRGGVKKDLKLSGKILEVQFFAPTTRTLRTSMGGFLDYLILCQDTIKEFDTISNNSVSEKIENDAGTHSSSDTS